MTAAPRLAPLGGIRVLDFTAFPPGGAASVMLADLGAEVIRVEPPAQAGRPSLVIGQVAMSRGKRSMTLDLRDPRANDVLRRLAPGIDVVVENARPGAMAARGFGYPQASEANPRLVWCAITGFGQTGPYADRPGHDLSYLAQSGLLAALAGEQSWQPALSVSLQAGALASVVAIQAALIARAASGHGAFIDTSLAEAAGWFLTCGINPLSETPLALPATADRRVYACADGRSLALACAEPRTWGALCDVVGRSDLKPALHDRARDRETTEALAAILVERPAAEWAERIGAAGGAATVVNHGAQLLDDPQVSERGAVASVGGMPVPASPIRITAPDGRATDTALTPPPMVGADTDAVLAEAGFTADERAQLRADALI